MAASLGIILSSEQNSRLRQYLSLLLSWNQKINLTAITHPAEALERHLVDSLGAAPAVDELASVVDIGSGGGLPGIPLAILNPSQQWVLVETVHKKVGFLKAAIAALSLKNVRAIQARAEKNPERERIPLCDGAISRAFQAPDEWFDLAQHYVQPPGDVIAMLGAETDASNARKAFPEADIKSWEYTLPISGIHRSVLRLRIKNSATSS
ncbi:MAG: 16S rRNA (guanine(527)-N(7))-methyltransferase RsmG [Myxococcales bacterium]|jgi:16S rRNA (guanine527-N7)-methyltransferase|nr:16S rRNA (guanine(527)-N(7))-methyltransferase RsmG [Myxococcales bacterium]